MGGGVQRGSVDKEMKSRAGRGGETGSEATGLGSEAAGIGS